MKITGGLAKGIQIKSNRQPMLRPATDFLRQAIFSSLGDLVVSASFLDLFAGTGAYGLEAWSRGASGGLFVEKDSQSIKTIHSNIQAVAKSMQSNPKLCSVIHTDVFKLPKYPEQTYEIIFADPPYEIVETIFDDLIDLTTRYLSEKQTSRIIIEVPGHFKVLEHPNAHLRLLKRIGKNSKNSPNALILSTSVSNQS